MLFLLIACSSAPTQTPGTPAAGSDAPTVASVATLESQLKSGARFSDRVVTGGQPEESLLQQAPGLGFDTVVNLRTLGEMTFDEAKLVQELGMTYVHVPVAGGQDLTPENAAKLKAALDASQGQALVHCASGRRVTGLMAIMEPTP
ncbi:MAG: hypothetical protein ACI9VR_000174 [Cognaticolwellia sp.]|jgi:uncharacterized protein (TIGR01244 family)